MKPSRSIAARLAALAQSTAADCRTDRACQQSFILRTVGLSFTALAAAPLFLAFHGAPSLGDTAVFGFSLLPLAAAMVVVKGARLDLGHAISAAGLMAVGSALALSRETGLACALAWLIAAVSESALSFDRRLVVGTSLAAAAVFAGLALAASAGFIVPARGLSHELLAGLPLAYAIVNLAALVTLRARLHGAVLARTSRAQTIAGALDDLVVTFDGDGTVDFVGRDCQRCIDLAPQELLGRGLFEHVHVADRPLFLNAIADAAYCDETIAATFRLRAEVEDLRRESGYQPTFLSIAMRAKRLPSDGARPGVVALLRNVTDERRTAEDLETARQAASAASLSRDHFLANVSHELRTPLNAIIGFSEILGNVDLRPQEADKQRDYARIIHQSGQHLLAVVNSILDMSKIQSGTFAIVPEPFLVGPLIDSCCDIVTLRAQEGGVEIVKAPAVQLDQVIGDRRACKQILLNLLSNAVKFTPANGRVTIAARPEGNSLLISVTDTGIGIGPADLARLGDPFFQARSAPDRPYEGTGLGLSVVRGLVGLHGGAIAIESELGQGTSVTVRLPLDCRFVTPASASAKIETIARRRPPHERFGSPPPVTRVKKIA